MLLGTSVDTVTGEERGETLGGILEHLDVGYKDVPFRPANERRNAKNTGKT